MSITKTIQNSIGVIEYLSTRLEEQINTSAEHTDGLTEDEMMLEDAKNVLEELYDLIKEE